MDFNFGRLVQRLVGQNWQSRLLYVFCGENLILFGRLDLSLGSVVRINDGLH
jgi:hypothetical protein